MRKRTRTADHVLQGLCRMSMAGCIVTGAACGDSEAAGTSNGTLVVPFAVGNNRACDDLEVATVTAELNDGDYFAEAACTSGQVRFRNVPAGTYELTMVGLDEDGNEILDSYTLGKTTVTVTGNDATNVSMPAVTLTAAPAHLLVRWNFGFTNCMNVGIEEFVIAAWRGDGAEKLVGDTLPCVGEADRADQYREIPDPERRFTGLDSGQVSVQPLDATEVNVGNAVIFDFRPPGPGRDVKISVDCGMGSCDGSGKPDP